MPQTFNVSAVLLDIEGTTSSIRFVYDAMFPFVRHNLGSFLHRAWEQPAVQRAAELIAKDAGAVSLSTWVGTVDGQPINREDAIQRVRTEVNRLMDNDVKATGLKELQGLIWTDGFSSGELVAHVYPDVPPAIRAWHQRGIDIRIYSSGSITAQKQFYAHTEAGNLLFLFSGHYDTTTGPKRESKSYGAIAADMNRPPASILFLSDVPAELDAASAAGFQTGLLLRPGNAPVSPPVSHPSFESFADIHLSGNATL